MKIDKNKSQVCNKYKQTGIIIGTVMGIPMGTFLGSSILGNLLIGAILGALIGIIMGLLLGFSFDKKVNSKALTIKEIIEDDHGCEGILVNEEPMVTIVVTDKAGNEQSIRMKDSLALKYNLEENDRVLLKNGVTLRPVRKG